MPVAVAIRPVRLLATVLLLAVVATLAPAIPASAASPNDDFADAEPITGWPLEHDRTVSTESFETGEPEASCDYLSRAGTTWFSFTPGEDLSLGLATDPRGTAAVAVWTGGPGLDALTEVACARRNAVTFDVTAGTDYWVQVTAEALDDVRFRLGRLGTLGGTVSHAVDGPVAVGKVEVFLPGAGYDTDTSGVGTDGTWAMSLPEGDWQIRYSDDNGTYAPMWSGNVVVRDDATTDVVTHGATTTSDLTVLRGATLSGTASDIWGGPLRVDIDGYDIVVIDVNDGNRQYYGIFSGTSYTVSGLPPGTFAVFSEGPDPYDDNWSDGSFKDDVDIADAPHHVLTAETDHVLDLLMTPASVGGRLTDGKSGDGIVGATVDLFQDDVLVDSTTTDGNGDYLAFAPQHGTITVRFSSNEGLYVTEWHDDAADQASATDFWLNSGEFIDGIDAVLTPLNVAPDITAQSFTVIDSSPVGTTVGTVVAEDRNAADAITYAITSGNTDGAFAIDAASGRITLATSVDATTKATHTLTVRATDDNTPGLTASATVTVKVTNANKAPSIAARTVSVSETAPAGTTVADLLGSDPNGDDLTFSITGGNHGSAFALTTRGRLSTAAGLDHETQASYALQVRVSDGEFTDTATITVLVTDVNEVAPSAGFTDTGDSVFKDDIDWLAWVGVTKGCNPPANDAFCPESAVTRGQFAAFLARALDLPAADRDRFGDDDDSIFEDDINRLATAGITAGCNPPENDAFCPDDTVTRDQMAAFLTRALGLSDDGGGDLFDDDDDSIFERDIDRLGTAGITKGCNPPANTLYCPELEVTRGQMAAFLHRALGGVILGP